MRPRGILRGHPRTVMELRDDDLSRWSLGPDWPFYCLVCARHIKMDSYGRWRHESAQGMRKHTAHIDEWPSVGRRMA